MKVSRRRWVFQVRMRFNVLPGLAGSHALPAATERGLLMPSLPSPARDQRLGDYGHKTLASGGLSEDAEGRAFVVTRHGGDGVPSSPVGDSLCASDCSGRVNVKIRVLARFLSRCSWVQHTAPVLPRMK